MHGLILLHSSVASVSGWRRGRAGSSVPCVKQESAEITSFLCTAVAAPARRTPGTARTLYYCNLKHFHCWIYTVPVFHMTFTSCHDFIKCVCYRLKTPPRPQGHRTEPESRGVSLTLLTAYRNVEKAGLQPLNNITVMSVCASEVSGFRWYRVPHVFRYRCFSFRLLHNNIQHQRPVPQTRWYTTSHIHFTL